MSNTGATAPFPPMATPQWQARLLSHATMAKSAIRSGNYVTFNVLRAMEETKILSLPVMPPLNDGNLNNAKTDLDNLNSATVGTLNNGFSTYATDTEKLKDDAQPDKPAWETRIRNNGDELKKQAIAAIDASTNQAVDRIEQEPGPMRDAAADIFTKGRNAVMDFMQNLAGNIMNVLNNIADFFKGIWNAMVNAWDSVKSAAEDAWHTISGIFSFMAVSPALRVETGAPLKVTWPQEATTAEVSAAVTLTLGILSRRGLVASKKALKVDQSGLSAELTLYDVGKPGSDQDRDGIKKSLEEAAEQAVSRINGVKPTVSVG